MLLLKRQGRRLEVVVSCDGVEVTCRLSQNLLHEEDFNGEVKGYEPFLFLSRLSYNQRVSSLQVPATISRHRLQQIKRTPYNNSEATIITHHAPPRRSHNRAQLTSYRRHPQPHIRPLRPAPHPKRPQRIQPLLEAPASKTCLLPNNLQPRQRPFQIMGA